MPTIVIHFKELLQDSQELGSDDEHMVSRAIFDAEGEDEQLRDQVALIKQAVGSDFEDDVGSLEIIGDVEIGGRSNYEMFRRCVEDYYRACVGVTGGAIRVARGARKVRMRNNRFAVTVDCSYPIE